MKVVITARCRLPHRDKKKDGKIIERGFGALGEEVEFDDEAEALRLIGMGKAVKSDSDEAGAAKKQAAAEEAAAKKAAAEANK